MNGMLTEEMIEQVGWTLLHFLWQGLGIAILLAILLQTLRKASSNCRYLAGCVALGAMVAAPVGTYISLGNSAPRLPGTELHALIEATTMPSAATTEPVQAIKVVTGGKKPSAPEPSITERLNKYLPLLVSAWAIGVVILSLRLTAGWLRVTRLKYLGIEPVEEVWHERMSRLAQHLHIKQTVKLVQSIAVEVPTVIGWLRPIILMPAGCLVGLSPAQVEYILAHELAHVRRNDYLVNLLQCLAETILFYHPAVWWISKRIREEREHCCDDIAVSACGDRLEYARTLAALEELRGSQNQFAMAAAGAPLLQRIRRLLGEPERNPTHAAWPLTAVAILALVAALALGLRSSRVAADETRGQEIRGQRTVTNLDRSFIKKTNSVSASSKLYTIIIPSVSFDKQPLQQVLTNLTMLSKLHDPEGIGVAFFVKLDEQVSPFTGLPYDDTPSNVLVSVTLNNTRLADVLQGIIQGAEKPLKYSVEDREVVFDLKESIQEQMFSRAIHLDLKKFDADIKTKMGLTFDEAVKGYYDRKYKNVPGIRNMGGDSKNAIQELVRDYFSREGLDLALTKRANHSKSIFFNERKGILFVHSHTRDLELVEKIVERFKVPSTETEKQPRAESSSDASTNHTSISKGRKEILSRLTQTEASPAAFNGLTLVEAIAKLHQATRSADSGSNGVSFMIIRETQAELPHPRVTTPNIGLPNYVEKENGDPAAVVLKVPPSQTNLSLIAVLDCIATNNALQYTIEDYAVAFSFKRSEPAPLFWKTYKLNLEALNRKLNLFSPESNGTNASTLTTFLRNLFQTNGIDFSPTNPANAGKSMGFNSRGFLAVHATRRELDLIEKLLTKINSPPQIHIKASIAEVDEATSRLLKLDDLMKAAGTTNFNVPEVTLQKNLRSSATSLTTNSLVSQFTGVLTPELSTELLARLEKSDGVSIFPLPAVTTENYRQAQVQAVDIKTLVTGLTTVWTNGSATNTYSTETLPFGPVLDLIPKLSEDNSTIEMTIIATVTEFLGYDDPASLGDQNRTDVKIPLPRIKLRQLTSSATVVDGQTIILGGVEATIIPNQLGSKQEKRKNLIFLITPTLINSDGTRVQKL